MTQLFNKTARIASERSCYNCNRFWPGSRSSYPDWEPQADECLANKGYDTLKSFPFLKTKCRHFMPTPPATEEPK